MRFKNKIICSALYLISILLSACGGSSSTGGGAASVGTTASYTVNAK